MNLLKLMRTIRMAKFLRFCKLPQTITDNSGVFIMEKTSAQPKTQYQNCDSKFDSELNFEIIVDPNNLYSLREEWSALYNKVDETYFTQSFEWNWCCWQKVSEPKGDRLCCLIIRCKGQIVLIWPLSISRSRYFWSIAHPLAYTSTEYSDILVDTTKDSKTLIELALQSLIKNSSIDFMQIPNIRATSLLYQVVESIPKTANYIGTAYYVAWENYPDWDSYYQGLSKNMRHNLSRRFRALAKLGDIRFEMLGSDYQEELKWLLQVKENWVIAKKNGRSPFTSNYFNFLFSIMGHGDNMGGRMQMFVLKLDGKLIAAQLLRVNKTQVETVIGSYDPDYSQYSPFSLVTEHFMQWCFEQRLTVDFRFGDAEHKEYWKPEQFKVVSYEVCCSLFGKALVLSRDIYHKIKLLLQHTQN